MTGDPTRHQPEEAIERMALEFFARGRSGDSSAEETATIERWLARDPRHRAAFDSITRLWTELDGIRLDSAIFRMREEAVGAMARRRRRKVLASALAASLLAGIMFAGATSLPFLRSAPAHEAIQERMFTTRIGQIAHVDLPDGSVAVLDTDSAIRSRIGDHGERRIEVVRGRVQFAVASMPKRPFSVLVNDTRVTALGTRFDVYRQAAGIEVNLVEGRLRVAQRLREGSATGQGKHSVEMAAGDRLVVKDRNWRVTRDTAAGETDWVKGQLVFENAPIGHVVSELNRYTTRKLVLTDRALAGRPISAVIRTDNPEMFLNAVRAMNVEKVSQQ